MKFSQMLKILMIKALNSNNGGQRNKIKNCIICLQNKEYNKEAILAKMTSYNYKTKILSNYKTIKLLLLTSNYQKEITTNSSMYTV